MIPARTCKFVIMPAIVVIGALIALRYWWVFIPLWIVCWNFGRYVATLEHLEQMHSVEGRKKWRDEHAE